MSTSMVAGEVETLRSQLDERERTIAGLEEQWSSWQQERAELQQEASAMKDKLNVAEVCANFNLPFTLFKKSGMVSCMVFYLEHTDSARML